MRFIEAGFGLRRLAAMFPTLVGNVGNMFLDRQDKNAPLAAGWTLSFVCDARCRHCAYFREVSERDLGPDELLLVARDIQQSGIKFVSLLGGEPLLLPNLFSLIDVLNENGDKHINMTTNGGLLLDRMEDVLRAPLGSITISLDSAFAEKHDEIRRNPGLFQRASDAIDVLKRRKPTLPIWLRFTVMRQNVTELEAFYERFSDKVDHISFQPVQDNGIHRIRDESVLLDGRSDYEALKRSLKRLARINSEFGGPYYELLPEFVLAPESLPTKHGVRCLLNSACYVAIMPDGGVHPCERFREGAAVGYVPQEPIEEIWRKPEMFAEQREMRNSDCICWPYNQSPNLRLQRLYRVFGRKSKSGR